MEGKFSDISRSVSIISRLMQMYYNHALEDYGIGWGQQFYVEYLYDHPGASAQEISRCIRVDKATLTKVVHKLSQMGFLRVEADREDKRVRHLYLTESALPAARRIKEIHTSFYKTLSGGLSEEELGKTQLVLEQMVKNINMKVWHRMDGRPQED